MLIHATPHACFVILSNGLTLELFYDEALTGSSALERDHRRPCPPLRLRRGSQGVWLFGEEVLFEVRAGQA